ncbi:fimbrillin family protein [Bacteroides sp. 51]|uniref:fimbrillin family protein n=1 Tax=Bacteroides sp. 51 TaxID=2302938 RepID=UPI0013D46441|nr:fimbrillin family protein [Bacteroides sp. 51]NDV81047.1 hypothetical protein [Bacteroides sp. 51]
MKAKYLIAYMAGVLLVTGLTGCSNESEPLEAGIPGEEQKMTLIARLGEEPDTRIQYVEDGTAFRAKWTNEDKLAVYGPSGKQEFSNSLSAGQSEYSTAFTGTFPGTASDYPVFYPYKKASETKEQLKLAVAGQKQTGNNNRDHITDYDYMTGNAILSGESGTVEATVALQREMAMIKFVLTIPGYNSTTDGSIQEVSIGNDTEQLFYSTKTLGSSDAPNAYTASLELAGLTDLDISSTPLTAYMMFIPVSISGKEITIAVDCENTSYSYTQTTSKSYSAGYYYTATISTGWAKETKAMATPSNCYLLGPGKDITIPVSRANDFTTSIGEADAIGDTDELTAELVWMDAEDLVTLSTVGKGKTGGIKVTAATGKSGNALVAVKVGDEIKWSWHIWVTDYNPDPDTDTWMNRNLGAITNEKGANGSTGLYYQWGRKDPFPGSASAITKTEPVIYSPANPAGITHSLKTNTSVQTTAWTVVNPDTFIETDGSSWMENSTGNDLNWNTVDNKKTLLDPCPQGYRVPSDNAWAELTIDNFLGDGDGGDNPFLGRYAADYGGWYPAAGLRYYGLGGRLLNVKTTGYYWANTSYDAKQAYILYFTSASLNPRHYYSHAYGFPVRCVAESN